MVCYFRAKQHTAADNTNYRDLLFLSKEEISTGQLSGPAIGLADQLI